VTTTGPEILGLPAAQTPATQAALARARRGVLLVLALGIVGLAGFVVAVSVVGDANDELRVHGIRTSGAVATLYPDSRYSEGHADIRFTVGGRDRLEPVDLGSDTDYYSEGQRVTVYYDAADPSRMTIDDEDNQPGWTVWPMCIALVVGFIALIAAPITEWRRRRAREVLRSGSWQQVRVHVSQGDKRLLFTTPDMSVWRSASGASWPMFSRLPWKRAGWGLADEESPTVPADQSAWWVMAGNRAVFSPDRGWPLVLTRQEPVRRRDRIR
jgi:hypothetical protein